MPLKALDLDSTKSITVTKASNGAKYQLIYSPANDDFPQNLKHLTVKEIIDNDNTTIGKIADIEIETNYTENISVKVFVDRIMVYYVTYSVEEAILMDFIDAVNEINSEEAMHTFIKSPPELKVVSGEKSVAANLGTYEWTYFETFPGALGCVTNNDCSHPLMWSNIFKKLETDTNEAELIMPEIAYKVEVKCYSDKYLGLSPDEAIYESIEMNGNKFNLKSGAYIYEIYIQYATSPSFGECTYGFYAEAP